MAEALDWAGLVAQFPVSVVNSGDCSRPHDPFELVSFYLAHVGHGFLQRDLDLGQRRDRHPDGQVIVENVVLPKVGMGEHEIPEPL